MQLSGVSDRQIKDVRSRLERFSEAISYQINHNDISIYIHELKLKYSPETFRKHVLDIRRFLKFLNVPFADNIKLPKRPKNSVRNVIRATHVKQLIDEVNHKVTYEPLRLRTIAAILLAASSGLRAEEVYNLTYDAIDLDERKVILEARKTKDFEDRITFFSREAKEILVEYFDRYVVEKPFSLFSIRRAFDKVDSPLRLKHMRKFFSQQSDRLGMPTAIKKLLMGHSLRNDVDLQHYAFQDEEEQRKIYDRYWRDFKILESGSQLSGCEKL